MAAIFAPTAFIPGISGRFYRQFALTIAGSVAISGVVSLTLSPALCAILLKFHGAKPDWFARIWNLLFGWFFRGFNWLFDKVGGYTGFVPKSFAFILGVLPLVLSSGASAKMRRSLGAAVFGEGC